MSGLCVNQDLACGTFVNWAREAFGDAFSNAMFPLISFMLGCVAFTILGVIVLACVPALRLRFLNLLLFLLGAFPSGLLCLFIYGRLFCEKSVE